VPIPPFPVDPGIVQAVFQPRWRGKYRETSPWRIRGLAVIAVAMSLPKGITIWELCSMLPLEVLQLQLRMPLPAWKWVVKWLCMRRSIYREASDRRPWLTWGNSRGKPRQISWAATRTLHRAGLPGWRVSKLMQSGWGIRVPQVPFEEARRFVPPDSWLWGLAASARRNRPT